MQYTNCTPHAITITPSSGTSATYPPSGHVARLQESITQHSDDHGHAVVDYGRVEGLPAPQRNTLYIVSLPVALALRSSRNDLVVPYDQVRDENNSVVIGAARRLARLA